MRVCQVMECTIGGTRRHISDLCIGLAARGVDVTLVASAARDPSFHDDLARIREAGAEVVVIPMARALGLRDLGHLLRIFLLLLRGRFDIVHTHSSKAGALGRAASVLTPWREVRVHTPHTFAFNFTAQFSARKRRLFLGIERVLGRFTHRLIHVGPSERDEGLALGIVPPERAVVVENGIDPAPYRLADRERIRAELGLAEQDRLVLAVGLLNEAKGHPDLIEAARLLRDREQETPASRTVFAIVGDGSMRSELEASIEAASLGDRFLLLGYRTDVPDVLAACDVFAMPSLWEGMPYVVLEAMASGRPVIASDVNGCRDLVRSGETGVLVPAGAPSDLADAVAALLSDEPRRSSLGAAGRALVLASYSVDAMIDRYVDLYQQLVRR